MDGQCAPVSALQEGIVVRVEIVEHEAKRAILYLLKLGSVLLSTVVPDERAVIKVGEDKSPEDRKTTVQIQITSDASQSVELACRFRTDVLDVDIEVELVVDLNPEDVDGRFSSDVDASKLQGLAQLDVSFGGYQ